MKALQVLRSVSNAFVIKDQPYGMVQDNLHTTSTTRISYQQHRQNKQPVLMPTYQNKVFVRLLPGHDSGGLRLLDRYAVATYEHMQFSTKRIIYVRMRGWKGTAPPSASFTLSPWIPSSTAADRNE
ncbi:MAG: hypothetical protein J3Q66DRAFT_368651 [Benniella sp.]|nr:MAG: hypothetical protein J3Q66DRAFT_368649 [Benniella sp.]KAK3818567.1 MAG: hypothetical protein J3Q66DRAFT_368651 [Benniella sp.]